MPDMEVKRTERVEWEKIGTLPAGTSIKIIVDGAIVFDRTVPAGKKLRGRISVEGTLTS